MPAQLDEFFEVRRLLRVAAAAVAEYLCAGVPVPGSPDTAAAPCPRARCRAAHAQHQFEPGRGLWLLANTTCERTYAARKA